MFYNNRLSDEPRHWPDLNHSSAGLSCRLSNNSSDIHMSHMPFQNAMISPHQIPPSSGQTLTQLLLSSGENLLRQTTPSYQGQVNFGQLSSLGSSSISKSGKSFMGLSQVTGSSTQSMMSQKLAISTL